MKKKIKRRGPTASPAPKHAKKATPKLKVSIEDDLAQAIKGTDKESVIEVMNFSNEAVIGHVSGIVPVALALDKATGIGGLPRGRIVEIYGRESSGKTTAAQCAAAAWQRYVTDKGHHGVAALYEPESKWDRKYAQRCGVNVDKLLAIETTKGNKTVEVGIEAMNNALDHWIAKGNREIPLLLIYDSVAASSTEKESEDLKNKEPGLHARELRRAMRVLTTKIAQARATLLCINQEYAIIGGAGGFRGPKRTTFGGGGIRYHASIRIEMIRTGSLEVAGYPVGIEGICRVFKNSLGVPRDETFAMASKHGFDNAWKLVEAFKDAKLLSSEKGNYRLKLPDGDKLEWTGGFAQLDEMTRVDPALLTKLTALYYSLP